MEIRIWNDSRQPPLDLVWVDGASGLAVDIQRLLLDVTLISSSAAFAITHTSMVLNGGGRVYDRSPKNREPSLNLY
jgi:hypothetical protein